MSWLLRFLFFACLFLPGYSAEAKGKGALSAADGFIAIIEMDMMILPGTQGFLEKSIKRAHAEGAKALVVKLNTPGGMLGTSQKMIQSIFDSPVPIIVYVGPRGGSTATSAGVFITLAGHIAAMGPGTSIGAAHPVSGAGQDIEGDMRTKVENMTVAMVKSIAEQRGRNVKWAEESVKESSSLTEQEALQKGVVDIVADDITDLLTRIAGKEIKVQQQLITLDDLSKLPRSTFDIALQDKFINLLANPNIAALLWLGATTGISLELYNPGSIVPGVIGVICLILALAVSQVIPINSMGLALLIVGSLLIGAEFFITSGVLGLGGVIAIVIGSLSLIDTAQAPTLRVSLEVIMPVALIISGFLLFVVQAAIRSFRRQVTTGLEGLVGLIGEARSVVADKGKVFVNGEIWDAVAESGIINADAAVEVVEVLDGLKLAVKPVKQNHKIDKEN